MNHQPSSQIDETISGVGRAHCYKIFFSRLPDAALVADDQLIIDANEAFLTLFGWTAEDVIGMNVLELIHLKDRERIAGKNQQCTLNELLAEEAELTALRSDGTPIDLEVRAVSQPPGDNNIWMAIFRDITGHRRGLEAIQRSEEGLKTFIESISDTISLLDSDWTLIFQSPAMQTILGYDRDEITGVRTFDLIHPEDRPVVRAAFDEVLRTGSVSKPVEYRCLQKDGTWRFVFSTACRVTDSRGNSNVLVNTHDVTEYKRMEERIARINRCRLGVGFDHAENIDRITEAAGELLGATCAIYNRLEGSRLRSVSVWCEPPGYQRLDTAEGHICCDVIHANNEQCIVINDLQNTKYVETDPNVRHFDLRTYVGHVVKQGNRPIGSLCAVFCEERVLSSSELHFLADLADALGTEEERHASELALRVSEERYRLLAENATDLIWQMDLDSTIIYVSPSAGQLGYDQSEMTGRSLADFLAPEERDGFLKKLADDIQEARQGRYEVQMLHKDGTLAWMEVSMSFVIENGVPVRAQGIGRNITQRKLTEEALRVSEERFRIAALCASELIYEVDMPTGNVQWHRDLDSIKPYALHRCPRTIGEWKELIHPEDRKAVSANFHESEKNGSPFFIEYRLGLPDGSVRYWNDQGVVLCRSDGRPVKCIGVVTDITEKKQAEAALRESEAKFRSYIDQSVDGVFVVDETGRYLEVNPAGCALTGYSEREILSMSIADLCPPDENYREAVHEQYSNMEQTGKTKAEVTLRRKDGTDVIIELHGVALGNSRYLGLVRDITERKYAEQAIIKSLAALERSYNLQSEFVRNMTHEVRTPLTGVIGYAQALLEGVTGNVSEEQRRVLKRIVEQAETLLGIVEEVLESATLAAGVQKLDLRTISLSEVIDDVLHLFENQVKEKGISITRKVPSRLPVVVSDAAKLSRILNNLVSNSVKFTFCGGVSLRAQRSGDGVDVIVEDTGIGIPADRQDQIFDAFVQLSYPGKHKPVGAGLGLSIVSELVDVLGLSLTLSSLPKEGTAFTLHVPLRHEEE